MFKPEGIYVAMLTPFTEDGALNEEELRRIVDFQITSGVHGLFPVSSVGESIHMSRAGMSRRNPANITLSSMPSCCA